MEEAIKFSKVRQQFGSTISSFQAIQHILADMAIGIEASRALVYATARYIDGVGKDYSGASAIAKVFPTDMAMKVTVDALQVLGGSGYMKEYPVEKMMRDAKILQIYEGTNQIQRSIIANELLKKY
jgi:butyryl-CoA dehydrogenase